MRCSFQADKGTPVQKAQQVFPKVAETFSVVVANKGDVVIVVVVALVVVVVANKGDVVALVACHF